MLKRLMNVLAAILLVASATLVLWQGSFDFGRFRPEDPEQTFVFFGVSLLIFLLMVTLGFMLVRIILKLWVERRSDRLGSRIRTKLITGALALSLMPVIFMVLFNYYVMNRTLKHWFTGPTEHVVADFQSMTTALEQQTKGKALAEAQLIAALPETLRQLEDPAGQTPWLESFCVQHGISAARIIPAETMHPVASYGRFGARPAVPAEAPAVVSMAPIIKAGKNIGSVMVSEAIPIDLEKQLKEIRDHARLFQQLGDQRKSYRSYLLQVLFLIALFVLFVSAWMAHFLARQISGPISALVRAAEEVSRGNLSYRVDIRAMDELAQLVGGFNRMTADLEANRGEIDARRRFTEAILESIPTGIISVDAAGAVQRVNKALDTMFPGANVRSASRLDDLFSREDVAEIRYLMNRARRTGLAAQQLEVKTQSRTVHVAVTVAAVERGRNAGFVVVIEDTSDLLRAQKAAAWSEVARRVAHEIRNPLTPIALSAERILRQVNRTTLPVSVDQLLRECAGTILEETASVKRLVDEFSQFSRLPAARPVICDLNDVVMTGMSVFEGRLEGIELTLDLAPGLPPVSVDPEQFKRVVVNLVDNAAEAMQDSPVKILQVMTRAGLAESVELVFADSGCGITSDQKEKLFLPYFSTKDRGTGLGLAIVSHILAEHDTSIRVEDNKPCGARFTVELPAAVPEEQKALASPATLIA
ncbi:MAG: two-component system, NtrC family, nitrogen regulation sensor histidine kinase NtrY [Bryobacterales bacterium]|nr:two-component system, NtrC family, nitrogen regulation sensor histidine kinase NtrY [Bryobacterales bacterium]